MEPDRLGRRVWALFTQYRASLVAIVVAVLAEDLAQPHARHRPRPDDRRAPAVPREFGTHPLTTRVAPRLHP
jgi:hypothetical protein